MRRKGELPRGTPTFLFTDIEGSTRLLDRLGDRYPPLLGRHRQLLVDAFEEHGGVIFGSEGDALFVVFEVASGAVAGAIAGQQRLAEECWPEDAAIRVRMGMHTGEVTVVDDDYVGMTVHVAARVAASGHGGQVLLTETTATLAGHPDAIDHGRHRLKDVGEHRLLQLRAPGLDQDFPPLRTLSALPNNLPAPVDGFVGRAAELDELLLTLADHRLVTLTGPGGSGKTRLALEAAARVLADHPDGVWLVDLSAIDDDVRVTTTVAQALRISAHGNESVDDTLGTWLRDRDLLLVLDNCEHVLAGAGAFCSRFLAGSPGLRILATSRAFLDVRGERGVHTPPLAVPDGTVEVAAALQSDAVELFVARAVAAAPHFDVASADVETIVQICRRLDGLPLAIELAAARLRALSVDQLADRLHDRFRLLGAGGRSDVARHQTLEAVVAWSYELLDEAERRLFERLGVFPHHFSLEMVEAVAADPPVDQLDVVDVLTRLVERSLVATVVTSEGGRYQLLETLRQYGLDRLVDRGEEDRYRDRLLDWSLAGVAGLEAAMRTPAMDDELRRARADAVTHRAALRWALERDRSVDALRIASLVPLSVHRGERTAEILALLRQVEGSDPDPATLGHAWAAVGNISAEAGDYERASEANARAAEAFEAAGLTRLAIWSSHYQEVHSHWVAGSLDLVDRLVVETVDRFRAAGDQMGLGFALWTKSQRTEDLDAAEAHAAEADTLLRMVGIPSGIAHNIEGRGIIALERGRLDDAAAYVSEAVEIFASFDNLGCTAHALEAAAVVLSPSGPPSPEAVHLLGAAEQFRERSGQSHRPWEIRARGGATADRVAELDAALAAHPLAGEQRLEVVAEAVVRALRHRRDHSWAET